MQAMAIYKSVTLYFFALLLAFGNITAFSAEELQSRESVQAAAEAFVQQKLGNIEGEVSITSTPPDARIKIGKCNNMEASLPSGNKLWGRTSIKVVCNHAPSRWSLYIPVQIKVTGNALVSTRSIGTGQVIGAEDVDIQTIDLTSYPIGIFTQPEQAIGRTTSSTIPAGKPVRPELLRSQLVIRQGQQVVIIAIGESFKVSSEGHAMNNASVGQLVSVKTKSGQIVKGIAKEDGIVEITF